MNKPKGTRKRYADRLTAEERQQIIVLSKRRPRISQRQIAVEFKCSVMTIRRIQQAAGIRLFPEITPELEKEIVEVLRQGKGIFPTAKLFGVSDKRICKLMAKHGIHHATGDPGMAPAKRMRLVRKVLERDDFANHIAAKEGVSRDTVLRIAHKLYGEGRFRNRERPLRFSTNADANVEAVEANCQRFFENIVRKTNSLEASVENFREQMDHLYVAMVEKHLELWHHGQVPPDREALVYEVLEINLPKALRGKGPLTVEQWDEHRVEVGRYIRRALDHVAGPESVWTN